MAVYRGGAYRAAGAVEQSGVVVRTSITYPVPKGANNKYRGGAAVIVDNRPPFNTAITVTITNKDYPYPRTYKSTEVIPLNPTSKETTFVVDGITYTIYVDQEPVKIADDNKNIYYTYDNNKPTPSVNELIQTARQANNYLLNLVDITLPFSNTGDLRVYGLFHLLAILERYKDKALHVAMKNGISTRLMLDFFSNKELFYKPGLYGFPRQCSIWRGKPDVVIYREFVADVDEVGGVEVDKYVEVLVLKIYAILARNWVNITGYRGVI